MKVCVLIEHRRDAASTSSLFGVYATVAAAMKAYGDEDATYVPEFVELEVQQATP